MMTNYDELLKRLDKRSNLHGRTPLIPDEDCKQAAAAIRAQAAEIERLTAENKGKQAGLEHAGAVSWR